jgi:NAD(P)-dependent dehydrogenase (short-subunit alcohol dehydrogenase family)
MRRFADKVAVITGAGSGIGRALALDLAGRGARLAISDINQERIDETVALCAERGAEARGYRLDVADRAAVLAHADEVVGEFGRANLVINNAGVALAAPILEMKWDDLEWVMNIDFWGVVHGTKAFLPHLIESGDGHVVNISSVFGLVGVPTQSAYNAAKFAVRGFTEALRQEMAIGRYPVGVSCVHPGGVRTNIARDARTNSEFESSPMRERFDQTMPTTPAKAAQIILRGVRANHPRILVGPDAYAFDATARVLGPFYQRVTSGGARLAGFFGVDIPGARKR